MKYGLLEEIYEVGAYILGNNQMPWIPYVEDGDWTQWLPKYEPQAENYETNGCTVWGSQNQIETFYKRVYGEEPNYAERFNYLRIPVDPNSGVDPQLTYENIRKDGLVDNKYLPVPRTKEEFLDASDIDGSLLAKGQNWLRKHDFQHEWLWRTRPSNAIQVMKDALKTSPLGVSVSAWFLQDGKYVDMGRRNNHWCICYKIDEQGIYVFDSYDHSTKLLSLDHNISRVKRIWINKWDKRGSRKHKSLLELILKRLTMSKSFLDYCEEALGTDASPSDMAPDELGCAETVSTLLRKKYPEVPVITGTWTLFDYLKKEFVQVDEPSPETIIISPTVPGKPFPGHTGVFMEDMTIASNDSRTGKFVKNYTYDTWVDRYVKKGNYPIYLFKHEKTS